MRLLVVLALLPAGCRTHIAKYEGNRIRQAGCFGPWTRPVADVHSAAREAIASHTKAKIERDDATETWFVVSTDRRKIEGRLTDGLVTIKVLNTHMREPFESDTQLACAVFAALDTEAAAKVTTEADTMEEGIKEGGLLPPEDGEFTAELTAIDADRVDWTLIQHLGGNLYGGEVGTHGGLLLKLSGRNVPSFVDRRYVSRSKLQLGLFGEVHAIASRLRVGPSIGISWLSQWSRVEGSKVRASTLPWGVALDAGALFDTDGRGGGFVRASVNWPPFYGIYVRGDLLDFGDGYAPGFGGGLQLFFPEGTKDMAKQASGAVVGAAFVALVAPVVIFALRGLAIRDEPPNFEP